MQIRVWVPELKYSLSSLPNNEDFKINYPQYSLCYNLSVIAILGTYISREMVETFCLLWYHQNLSNLTFPARFIFEIWTALHYTKDLLAGIMENFDLVSFQRFLSLFENAELARIIDRNLEVPPQYVNHKPSSQGRPVD